MTRPARGPETCPATAAMRAAAADLLRRGRVDAVIGHEMHAGAQRARPCVARGADDVERLVVNPLCLNNLAVFLVREETRNLGRLAIVARPNDMRTMVVLVQEGQVEPDNVLALGIEIEGPLNPDGGREFLGALDLAAMEKLLNERYRATALAAPEMAEVDRLERMRPRERLDFWSAEFSRCIKCYACRQVCPLCYCARCIVEKSQPRWISGAIEPGANMTWNLARAFHLAGRCTHCGACARACPMAVRLDLLNLALARQAYDAFGYLAGFDHEAEPPMTTFSEKDSDEFVE